MIWTHNGFSHDEFSSKYNNKTEKSDDKELFWGTNVTETDDSHSAHQNDLILTLGGNQKWLDSNNLNKIIINELSIQKMKNQVKVKSKSSTQKFKETTKNKKNHSTQKSKWGRKKKSKTLNENNLEQNNMQANFSSREEKKARYYEEMFKRQEEREMKRSRRKENKKHKQESPAYHYGNTYSKKRGRKPKLQLSNGLSKKEMKVLKIEVIQDSWNFKMDPFKNLNTEKKNLNGEQLQHQENPWSLNFHDYERMKEGSNSNSKKI